MRAQAIDIDKQALAQELVTWRLRSGLTQSQAGDKFGVSRYSIMRLENMRYIGIAQAYRISAALAKAIREESQL